MWIQKKKKKETEVTVSMKIGEREEAKEKDEYRASKGAPATPPPPSVILLFEVVYSCVWAQTEQHWTKLQVFRSMGVICHLHDTNIYSRCIGHYY